VVTFLNVVTIVAAIVGVLVVIAFFVGPRE
jgi:hypothetical protein